MASGNFLNMHRLILEIAEEIQKLMDVNLMEAYLFHLWRRLADADDSTDSDPR